MERMTHVANRGPRRPQPLLLALFLALFLALLAGCGEEQGSGSGGARAADPAPPVPVRAVALAPADPLPFRLPGVVRAEREIALAFRIAGEIVERRVEAGQRVRAGELLFRLDPRDLERALEAADAAVAAARAEAELAEREAARRAELFRRRTIAAEDADRAESAARAARERLRAAEAQREQARLALDHAALAAPADGVVSEVLAERHEYAAAGRVVATLAVDGPREAEVFVPETLRPALPERGRALPTGGEASLVAVLRELAASAEPASRTFRARYRLEGLSPDAPVGGSLLLELQRPGEGLFRVPASALADRGRGPFLWRIAEGRVEARPVRVERLAGEEALVATDLEPGTPVVAMGTHRLHEGSAVRIVP